MELIYNLSQKGYFSNKNLLINTAEAMDAFESDKAVVIMSDIWSLYQQLGDDFEKKYMPGSLVVEEGEANEINSLSFILGIDSKSDAKENANLLIEFLSTDVNEDDIELPEGMHLLNTEADENSLYKKEYDYEVYMDKCAFSVSPLYARKRSYPFSANTLATPLPTPLLAPVIIAVFLPIFRPPYYFYLWYIYIYVGIVRLSNSSSVLAITSSIF